MVKIMWYPTRLLLGPGGVKGFMELGFLHYMEKQGLLDKIDTYAGVSIGAIICLLLVAGYRIPEIIKEASETNIFPNLNLINFQIIRQNIGMLSHQQIRDNLNRLIVKKFGKVLSLGELYQATGLDLYITALRLDSPNPQPVHFSHHCHPEISCVEAVLLSMNIPYVFHRLKYGDYYYIDGAFGDPYPIHLLDDRTHDVLGVYISSVLKDPDDFINYSLHILYAGMVQLRNIRISLASSRCRHVGLFSNSYDTIGLITDNRSKIKMITDGYQVARNFFDPDNYHQLVSADHIQEIEGE